MRLPISSKQRPAALDCIVGAGGYDPQLSRRGKVRPPEDRRRNKELVRLRMRGSEDSNRRHAMGTHRQMNSARSKRIADSPAAKCDVSHSGVLDQHRHHDIPILTGVGDRCRRARASRHKVRNLGHHGIVNGQIVTTAQDPPGHPLTHTTETNEADVHENLFTFSYRAQRTLRPVRSNQLPAHPFDLAADVVDDVAGLQVRRAIRPMYRSRSRAGPTAVSLCAF